MCRERLHMTVNNVPVKCHGECQSSALCIKIKPARRSKSSRLYHLKGMLWHFPVFPFQYFLCLRLAGLPGDGGWNELKWNVAMASVTLGDCTQGLQWTQRRCSGGWAPLLVFWDEHYWRKQAGLQSKKQNTTQVKFKGIQRHKVLYETPSINRY